MSFAGLGIVLEGVIVELGKVVEVIVEVAEAAEVLGRELVSIARYKPCIAKFCLVGP